MNDIPDTRIQRLILAIEQERKAEEAHYETLTANKTVAEKVDAGIAWYPLFLTKNNYTVGGYIELSYERTKHLETPHKLRSGKGCIIQVYESADGPIRIRARISFLRKNKICVIISEAQLAKVDISDLGHKVAIELVNDDRPYKIMTQAMNNVQKSTEPQLMDLRKGVEQKLKLSGGITGESYELPMLNESQNKALTGVSAAPYMGIIHGPPGTGKTTTLVALVKQLLKKEKKILVCAPSNNAVDLLASSIDDAGIPVVRVGNITRIADGLKHLTLAEKARTDGEWQHIKKVRIEASNARKLAEKFKRNFGAKERSDRKHYYKEARELRQWADDLEEKLVLRIIQESKVICTTLISASNYEISHLKFHTLIIDEASQALEPECWNAMLKAQRVILAGDHLQLAPTVKSSEAVKLGLSETLLTRMTGVIEHSFLLRTQYRMNEEILAFPNARFYGGKLESDDNIAKRTLPDDTNPLVFIDTSGCGFEESFNPKTASRYNEGEYFIMREHIIQQKDKYLGHRIGIISPYSEQVRFLKDQIENEQAMADLDIAIGSIDGFQGQERDIIYISLVRSNAQSEIGFLADPRRLNVAMTRAKMKLVIIGDLSTLAKAELFDALADHVQDNDSYESAWAYMDLEGT